MGADLFLLLSGGLLFLAFLVEAAFDRIRIPSVLVLMSCGFLLGPVFHIFPSEQFHKVAPHFGALAFLLILFEGGLDLKLGTVATGWQAGALLAVRAFSAGFALLFLVAWAAGMGASEAAFLAMSLAPISGSIVIPLAAKLGFGEETRSVVVLEAATADVLGILGMGFLISLLTGGAFAALFAVGSVFAVAFSVLFAAAIGLWWPRVLRWLPETRFADVLTFGLAMLLWAAVELPGASGALAVLVFGLVLANEKEILGKLSFSSEEVAEVARETSEKLHSFIFQLTFLVRAFFFVFLGAMVSLREVTWLDGILVLGLVGAMVLSRYWVLNSSRSSFPVAPEHKRTMWLVQPRGLVSAVLAMEAIQEGVAGPRFLGLVSAAIVLSNLLMLAGVRKPPKSSPNQPRSEL
ncbi:MAG: cation:proton antiporter domain-containing protein [Thermoanaerobaculaceae bacterium]